MDGTHIAAHGISNHIFGTVQVRSTVPANTSSL
jgi:hypothetical protein